MFNSDINLAPDMQSAYLRRKTILTNRFKSGANWFYFIAGFSVITLLPLASTLTLVLGLAMTQIVGVYANSLTQASPGTSTLFIKIVAIIISLVISAGFALAAYFSHQRKRYAFIAGLVVYGLDALSMLLLGQITAFAFHLLGLYGIWRGLTALQELAALEKAGPPVQGVGAKI